MVDLSTVIEAEHTFTEHEHRELAPGIARIHDVARQAGHHTRRDLGDDLLRVLTWVEKTLEPHAAWEDRVLYPGIDRLAGTPWATRVMRFEHGQIRELAVRLSDAYHALQREQPVQVDEIGGRLFAFEALLRAHIEREEKLLFPLLDG